MKSAMETVTAYLDAFGRKDMTALRRLLGDNYHFRGPMMSFDSPDAFIAAMSQFPCEATTADSRFVAEGERVAHAFVYKMTEPAKADVPMCEFYEVRDGKIQTADLFFNPKLFPPMPCHD